MAADSARQGKPASFPLIGACMIVKSSIVTPPAISARILIVTSNMTGHEQLQCHLLKIQGATSKIQRPRSKEDPNPKFQARFGALWGAGAVMVFFVPGVSPGLHSGVWIHYPCPVSMTVLTIWTAVPNLACLKRC